MNLVTDPWLTVTHLTRGSVAVGLADLFVNAHTYAALTDPSPVALAAQYRLLLAIAHRVYGPADWRAWAALWDAGQFDGRVADYLAAQGAAFDLARFGQADAGLGKPVSVGQILLHVATGNNATWADHTVDGDRVALDLPAAARALLTSQWGALSGRTPGWAKGNVANGLGAGHMQVMVTGATVLQTLLLNLLRYDGAHPMRQTGNDAPMWEQGDPFAPRTVPRGYLDYLTWPTRRVRLLIDGNQVAKVRLGPGLVIDRKLTRDPMRVYRQDKNGEAVPLRFSASRALWRDADALLRVSDDGHSVTQWLTFLVRQGVITEAVTLNYLTLGAIVNPPPTQTYVQERRAALPLSVNYLADDRTVGGLAAALATSVAGAKALGSAAHTLKTETGATVDFGRYWAMLDNAFHPLYTGLPTAPDAALNDWQDAIRRAARLALAEATSRLGVTPRALRAGALANLMLSRRLAALT